MIVYECRLTRCPAFADAEPASRQCLSDLRSSIYLIRRRHNAKSGTFIRQTTLHERRIRRTHRTVR